MRTNSVISKIAIILIFITILFGLRLVWLSLFVTSDDVVAENGVLDLRGRTMDQSKLFNLSGEWSFYPSQSVSHKDIPFLSSTPTLLKVPGDWTSAMDDGDDSSYGYGSYRLRILVDPLQQPISLWFKEIKSASTVEINGTMFPSHGTVSKDSNSYSPDNTMYRVSYFSEGVSALDVFIQVSNYDSPFKGGIEAPVIFGSQDAVEQIYYYSVGSMMLTVVILLLHCLYAFILYSFNPKERALLMAGFMTLSVAMILMARNDNLIVPLLSINYTWSLKIRWIAFLWQNLLILLVFRKFVSGAVIHKWLRIYTVGLVVYSIFIMFAPTPLVSTSMRWWFIQLFQYVPFVWLINSLGQLLFKKNKDEDILFLLLSGAAIISNYLWSLAGYSGRSVLVYYPLDIISAIVGFSAYWFKKYFYNVGENMKLNQQLKIADNLKDQFLANTSHELRTPLHGIINIAQNIGIKEDGRLLQSSRKDLELLITVSQRMSHMLEDLQDVARLREHRIMLKQEPVSIQSVVPGVIGMLKYMIQGKPVELSFDIPDSFPDVYADEKRLVQILYNLVHNALKYTEEGHVTVSVHKRDGRAVIQVSDTGVGMSADIMERAFLPYEQGPHGIRDGRGIGLGLSICQQLVELHGSELNIQSELGKGSVFSFALKFTSSVERQAISTHRTSLTEPNGKRHESMDQWNFSDQGRSGSVIPEPIPPLLTDTRAKLLVVDDDPVNLNVLRGILANEPYDITTANSAHEALALLDQKPWDLMIADVMMPSLSGYELTQKVREHYSISDLPVLLLTARSQPADIYTGFLSGANDYVTKPVDSMELRYRIRALTAMKHSYYERLRVEAAYLQAQINPHFLFNALNSIVALSEQDIPKMQQLVDAFSTFLQISFDFQNTGERVPLSHELALVEAYLHIEQTRFAERLSVVWEIEPNIHVLVPPLSIQPLVENAVKHSLLKRREGVTIHIHIARKENAVYFEVKDNGPGMDQTTLDMLLSLSFKGKNGIGLNNTHRRLIQLFGQGLTIQSQPDEGSIVSFLVPDPKSKIL